MRTMADRGRGEGAGVAMNRLVKRVDRLEGAAGTGDKPHHCIVLTVEQADAPQAVEKYRGKHPDVPEHATFILRVMWTTRRSYLGDRS